MRHPAFPNGLDRGELVDWYRRGRARSAALFSIPTDSTYYERPITLRNPIAFYEGHLPAFAVITILRNALGEEGIDPHYETLFARGIDPESEEGAKPPADVWPSRDCIRKYAAEADDRIANSLASAAIEDGARSPLLQGGEAVLTILEHELMHQETLLYMFHQLSGGQKNPVPPLAASTVSTASRAPQTNDLVAIPAGIATLGADRDSAGFGWDNEFPAHAVDVPPFSMQRFDVTNAEFMEFVEAGGYREPRLWNSHGWEWLKEHAGSHPHFWIRDGSAWLWRGQFERLALPPDWPVYVTHAEAQAYALWRGMRLPTEAEYHRAAFGSPDGHERSFPWGEAPPDETRGNFGFTHWDPVPVGSYPAGRSAWGIEDLVGNGWEWTSTPFAGFEGFEPMPSYPVYSSDFFDGRHFVLKGASPVTAHELIRRSFRNWFRAEYPYVYATFRCVV